MEAELDLNANRIINVGTPVDDTDAVRKVDVDGYITDAEALLTDAEAALAAAAAAQASADGLYAAVESTQATVTAAVVAAELARDQAQQAVLDAQAQVNLAADQVDLAADQVALAAAQVVLATAQTALAAAQVTLATAQRVLAQAAAADATTAKTQAELAAMAAGSTIYVSVANGEAATVDGDVFLVSTAAGVQVYDNQLGTGVLIGWLGRVYFTNVTTMLAFTGTLGPVGTTVYAGRYRYQTVSSGQHVTTAGGSKLTVYPGEDGYDIEAFGADMTGVASANSILTAASAVCVAANEPLVVKSGTLLVNASLTLACAITVKRGGGFNITSGTLTLNGEFRAGLHSVFTVTGTGPTWGPNSIDFIRPEWFGAKARGSSGTAFDSAPGIQLALTASSRGTQGFTYVVRLSQGIYDVGTQLAWPIAGSNTLRGMGCGVTQLRGMNLGGGYPNSILHLTTGTAGSRIEDLSFFGVNRLMNYGVTATAMVHTHFVGCSFANFALAGVMAKDNENLFERCDFSFCGVGLWFANNGNNNDTPVDSCTFVACEVGVAVNIGTTIRIRSCQFQAALTAPFTKTHIYVDGVTGFSVDNCYFESQSPAGMAGMEFTVPETIRVYADIIFNNAPYYSDEVGTVTTTLAQNSTANGTTGIISACNFNSPTHYTAGAGGTGYTAGAVTLTATNGQGTGASGVCTVSGSSVSSVGSLVGGTGFQIGDRVLIDQGGNVTASGTVTATTTNNAISLLMIGGNATVYPGSVRSLTIHGCGLGNAYLVLYDDPAYCNPRRVLLTQCVKASGSYDYQILGNNTSTVKIPMRNIVQDNCNYIMSSGLDHGNRNYFPSQFTFTPTVSTFERRSGRYQGLPFYRLALNAAQQTSDAVSGTFTVSSSGGGNAELVGQRIYFSVGKIESASNVKLRLTLSVTNGTSTVTKQNYDNSTSFTKSSGISREEVSIVVPETGGTVTWTMEVIAASAASQYVETFAPVIAAVGVEVGAFSRWSFEQPLTGSATYDAPSLADGATTTTTITVPGARLGDMVQVAPPFSASGMIITGNVSATNTVTIVINNESGGTVDLASGTWRVAVYPTT